MSLRGAINAKCRECIYDPAGGNGNSMDRRAFRRLDETLHDAELAWRAWGAMRRGEHAPNDLPGQQPWYSVMEKDWLEASKIDPADSPPYMAGMVSLYQRQRPVVQEFARLVWQHGRSVDQARGRLRMSGYAAEKLVRALREAARDVIACNQV